MTTPATARGVRRTYLLLILLTTLAASFIWGINTLFLLDAGLSNTEAFAVNAFFTAGMLVFEVPTGVVADLWGRRTSFLLGAATLLFSTLLYLLMWDTRAPLWGWAIASILLGLGFTFFSGAVEAWLVDALTYTGFSGELESVFGRARAVSGAATLVGSVAGGVIAQQTNLGVPYIIRAGLLGLTFIAAFFLMRDLGFTPQRRGGVVPEVRRIMRASIDNGLRNPPVRWLMLASPFVGGVGIYAFYALQPYLLELYGDEGAYTVAGLAAAIFAGAEIVGGLMAPVMRRLFRLRTDALLVASLVGIAALAGLGLTSSIVGALTLLAAWGLVFSAALPLRQTLLNGLIPSAQRATVLSFDSLMASAGGVVIQPALGRVADVNGYAASYLIGAVISAIEVPFLLLTRREKAGADRIESSGAEV